MRLLHVAYDNGGEPVQMKAGKRYRLRWKLNPGGGKPTKERAQGGFRTKGEAEAFMSALRRADMRIDGWTFDHKGEPVRVDSCGISIVNAADTYYVGRWDDWSENQRVKVRGRLCEFVALTVARPVDRKKLLVAYESQRNDKGPRTEPCTRIEWAGRWLRDHAFLPHAPEPDERALDGRRWLEAESLPVAAIDPDFVLSIRKHFTAGYPQSTARTYWQSSIVPFVNWLVDTRKLPLSPLVGARKMKRDMEIERPDPREIPDPRELAGFAEEFRRRHGVLWQLWVLLSAFCSLRISESMAVTFDAFSCDRQGRWWLDVRAQERTVTKAYSDDGKTSRVRTKTKSTFDRTPPPRLVPIPAHLALRLQAHFGDRLGIDKAHMFVGARGAIAPVASIREWWPLAVTCVFGDHPHLGDMKPHTLRHAGMTYWLAAGIDHKTVQRWGGWTSLKEMLDTYRGVIRSLEGEQLGDLESFHHRWGAPLAAESSTAVDAGETADAVVIELFAKRINRAEDGRS